MAELIVSANCLNDRGRKTDNFNLNGTKGGNTMFRNLLLITMFMALIIFIPACGINSAPDNALSPEEPVGDDAELEDPEETPGEDREEQPDNDELIDPTDPDQLPADIQAWIEVSREKFQAQTRKDNGLLYILITYGEKPTGGYAVEITGVEEKADRLVVTVKFTEPGPDDMVTQALTYPYDLMVIDDPDLPTVEFVATEAESSIPILK
jgi:hypothetical protein